MTKLTLRAFELIYRHEGPLSKMQQDLLRIEFRSIGGVTEVLTIEPIEDDATMIKVLVGVSYDLSHHVIEQITRRLNSILSAA